MTNISYKYLPLQRIDYLNDQLLRFTPPADLNGPFECIPSFEDEDLMILINGLHSEDLKTVNKDLSLSKAQKKMKLKELSSTHKQKIKQAKANTDWLKEIFYKEIRDSLNSKFGILSLSKRWDSTLMWSHYCSSHKGFCVGFYNSHPFFLGKLPTSVTAINDVIYSDSRIKITTSIEKLVGADVMFVKSKDWAYEQEERMLGQLMFADKKTESISSSFPLHLFKVPHESIKEIIMGVNISSTQKERIISFCKQNSIECFQSVISKVKFDMERKLLHL